MKQFKHILPIILFITLAFVIMFPLLSPGYILTLDMVLPPEISPPKFTSPSFLLGSALFILDLFLPVYIIQKIILFSIFFFSALSMYWLVPAKNIWAKVFAGLFYAVNPFVYGRIMAGHWPFLLGYAIFPYIVGKAVCFLERLTFKNAFILSLSMTLLAAFSPHFLFIGGVFFSVYLLIMLIFKRNQLFDKWTVVFSFPGLAFIFNLHWLLPTLLGKSAISGLFQSFDYRDLLVFQSVSDKHLGLIFNLLSGYGFWAEAHNYFILPKSLIFFWPVLVVIIIAVSAFGFYKTLRQQKLLPLSLCLLVLFLFSLDLAGGVAISRFAEITYYFYQKIPLLRGLREPNKLIAVVVFFYAYFGGYGLSFITAKARGSAKYGVIITFLLLPFVLTPTVFGGFWGQLKPVFYPSSWSKANNILRNDKDEFLTVFFPWHQYMGFKFANNQVIASPATKFFDKPILSSHNLETNSFSSREERLEALHVEGLLSIETKGENLLGDKVDLSVSWPEALAAVNIKYVLLAKEEDWQEYDFLQKQKNFRKIYDSDEIALYQNLSWQPEYNR